MQNQSQPEENHTLQMAQAIAAQTPPTAETEADTDDNQHYSALFIKITRSTERARRQQLRLTILAISLCVTAPFLALFFSKGYEARFFPLGLLPALAIYALHSRMMRYLPEQEQALSGAELARVGGMKAIPALFTASSTNTQVMQMRASRAALTLLLPRMRAKDAYLLTGDARRTINRWLRGISDCPTISEDFDALRIAALKALAHAGDLSALPAVTQLTEMTPRTTSEALLQQAAVECLPALKTRCGEDDAKRTLLRASHATDARPDTLLRPASHSGQTDSAELLRGADSPETPPSEGEQE